MRTMFEDRGAASRAASRAAPRLPRHDGLTGLLNHREFQLAIETRLGGGPSTRDFAVILLDLDGFRDVNDRRGHAEGDALLRRVAGALTDICRDSDVKARTDGDEFALLLPGVGAARAAVVCRDVERAIRALDDAIGVSCGVAVAPEEGGTREELMLRAQAALGAAKSSKPRRRASRGPGGPGGRAQRTTRAEEPTVQAQLEAYAADLRSSYARELTRSRELTASYIATVRTLATAVEAKDDNTGGHIQRVHDLGLLLARAVAPEEAGDPQLAYGCLLHDIGKLSIPDAILSKPGKLDEQEWALMHRHPEEGVRILSSVPFLDGALDLVRHHHERWDGAGYPSGLRGEEIPRWARLFSVVDTADAIVIDRPYRKGRSLETAVEIILAEAGRQFDPEFARAFASLDRDEIRGVFAHHAGAPAG